MKFLFDLFPIVLFFIAFKLGGVFVATAVAIAATAVQVAWVWWRHRKVDTMLWISLALITVFGGATLLLHDEAFIKWKPTVLYWLFATVLTVSALFFRKNLIQSMLGEQITLPAPVWTRLNGAWIVFFLAMGVLNLIFAFSFPLETWVNFKLFGGMGLMLVFVIAQSLYLGKYVAMEKKEKP
ncbi:septation protein A [Denitratisoma sp. DHT3]|uniref:septation protein A n=1 Tax=Denitratisoma sp. DHT3 TaxID=1981880 RepID=UPI00119873B3|nr:septation protein A [Denitratisoma sp. DHT3]QDX79831.1 septation protein A [Denitratisoma sp. DHT3]